VGGILRSLRLPRGEVEEAIGLVVGNQEWPSKVACLAGAVDFVKACGTAVGVELAGVGADFPPAEKTALPVDGNPKGIAAAHHEDLRSCVWRAWGEKIAFRHRIATCGLGMDSQDLATEIVGVA
jgi:hypothetical protein